MVKRAKFWDSFVCLHTSNEFYLICLSHLLSSQTCVVVLDLTSGEEAELNFIKRVRSWSVLCICLFTVGSTVSFLNFPDYFPLR